MARLIDADALPSLFDEKFKETMRLISEGESHLDNLAEGFTEAHQVVLKQPTIEAEPVRHGKWHRTFVDGFNRWHFVYDCSECGIRTETTTKYCPNCGAKMDVKKAEEKK